MMNITKRMKRSTKAALGLQLPFGKSKGLRSKDPKGRRVSALSPGKQILLWLLNSLRTGKWPIEIDDKHYDLRIKNGDVPVRYVK